jgi:hypothetical protein
MSVHEGAGGRIIHLEGGWVRKEQKRAARKGRVPINRQLQLQQWVSIHLTEKNGYRQLFCPAARPSSVPNSYEMQAVDVSADPFLLGTVPTAYAAEVERLRVAFEAGAGATMLDVEFYVQTDGRVAVVDFDQCF